MPRPPRVSVLMAVHNASPYLRQAVDSVLGQTLREVELLAVDDASTDDSLAILQACAARDARVRVFRQMRNQGQAEARNLALRHATGDFVCMLDADDWFSPDALEQAVRPLADERVGCVVFRLIEHRGDCAMPYPSVGETALTGEEAFRLALDWRLHGLCLVRRTLHLSYPYDTACRLYSDDNTSRLHYLHSPLVAFCPGEYHYRKHEASSTSRISPDRFLYMQANLSLRDTLVRESAPAHLLAAYERIRWHNYLGQLRLFHRHRAAFSPADRRRLHADFRRIYLTFGRRLPFPIFEFRQWLGYLLHR